MNVKRINTLVLMLISEGLGRREGAEGRRKAA